MSRQATPDILGVVLGGNEPPAVALRWDYSQAGEHAVQVQAHARRIKRSEARATAEIVAAGEELLAAKELLAHGQWLDWLQVEFGMADRTAQRLMAVATTFSGKNDTVSHLSTSVLYLLAAPSTPKAARDAVIDVAATKPVTKAQAQTIIAEHKPRTVSPEQRPLTNSEMAMINQGIAQDRADKAAARKISASPADAWQAVNLPAADMAPGYSAQWQSGQGYRILAADRTPVHTGLPTLAAVRTAMQELRPAPRVVKLARADADDLLVTVDGERDLPDWMTDDGVTVVAARGVGWSLTIDADTDPVGLGRELQGLVDSAWVGKLWDAYMGGE